VAGARRLPTLQVGSRLVSGEREIGAFLSATAGVSAAPRTFAG
jgi:hypothetical protein